MFIEIKGVQFVNKGAELMLFAVLQQLQRSLPHAKVVLGPGTNSPFEQRMQVGALQKFSFAKGSLDLNRLSYYLPKRLRNWLIINFGIITEADIDAVLDASGFAYGDQWNSLNIKRLCNEIIRRHKNSSKYILLPQALGPFSRRQDTLCLSKALPKATLILARESSSFKHIEDLIGSSSNLLQYGDFTNLVEPVIDARWRDTENMLLLIPNYNMLSPRNPDKRWREHYISLMVTAIKLGQNKGLQPLILNHEGESDEIICQQIKQQAKEETGSDVEVYHESDPLKVKGIIKSATLVVCSRFHGCVSALCQGIPCLGTSWSHKYERLFEEYQLSQCLLAPDLTQDALEEKLSFALTDAAECSADSRQHYKMQSQSMWEHVFAALE